MREKRKSALSNLAKALPFENIFISRLDHTHCTPTLSHFFHGNEMIYRGTNALCNEQIKLSSHVPLLGSLNLEI